MGIDFLNISNMSSREIIQKLDEMRRAADDKRKEIKEYKSANESIDAKKPIVNDSIQIFDDSSIKLGSEKNMENEFEKEVEDYIKYFVKLKEYSRESIEYILPDPSYYNYMNILLRLIAEVSQEMKDIREIIYTDSNMSKEDLAEYKEEVVSLENKRNILIEIMNSKEDLDEDEKEAKNILIFAPIKNSGKIRIFDEIKDIPEEEYEGFIELFDSIKDGTFKNMRKFYNNHALEGAYEVKGHQIRVVYVRLSKNCYAIISMFMKKTQNDNGYRKTLQNKYGEFKTMEKELKEKTKYPEFLLKNQEYEEELYSILRKTKDTSKGDVK